MKNLSNTILLAILLASLIIGLHQAVTVGFFESYWIFMITFVLFIIYAYRRSKK